MAAPIKTLICLAALGLGMQANAQEAEIDSLKAEAEYLRARLERVNAELALATYVKHGFNSDLALADKALSLAESDLARAEDRRKWSKAMHEKGLVSEATMIVDRLTLDKAKFGVEKAQSNRNILVRYIKDKTIKEHRAAIEKAKATEAEKKAVHEKARLDRIE